MSTPVYTISKDSEDITDAVRQLLLSLRVTDEAGFKSDSLELVLDDRAGLLALPPTGAELRVHMGYEGTTLRLMGTYTVDEVDLGAPPQTLTIRARAADFRASLKAPKTRPWHRTTLGDIVTQIAGEHGYTPRMSAPLAAIDIQHLDQTEESDIHLLTRLAREHGATVKAANGFLICITTAALKSASGLVLPTVELTASDLTTWRATRPERGKYTAVTARYHDRAAAQTRPIKAGEGTPVFVMRRLYPDAQRALSAAQAKLDSFKRGLATLSLTLPGDERLRAESSLTVSGIRDGVNGTWAITRVEHTIDADGFVTLVDAEVPAE